MAREYGDPDLEATALALIGLATIAAGDVVNGMTRLDEAYYTAPGHTVEVGPGTELVEFSPSDEYARTMEVVAGDGWAPGQLVEARYVAHAWL